MRNQLVMAERAGVRAVTINSENRDDWERIEVDSRQHLMPTNTVLGEVQLHIVDSGTAMMRSPSTNTSGPVWTTAPATKRSPSCSRSHVR